MRSVGQTDKERHNRHTLTLPVHACMTTHTLIFTTLPAHMHIHTQKREDWLFEKVDQMK